VSIKLRADGFPQPANVATAIDCGQLDSTSEVRMVQTKVRSIR
jgi:hypothetical protein